MAHNRKIAVIGLGYVGLPVAVAFARSGVPVTGFDIDAIQNRQSACIGFFAPTSMKPTVSKLSTLSLFATAVTAPASEWRYLDGAGTVGVIPSVTAPFCDDCDRVRLTAEGQFRTCLFATTEFDLRRLLRDGASDDDLAAEIQRAVGTKWAGHQIGQVNFIRPARTMSQIGG